MADTTVIDDDRAQDQGVGYQEPMEDPVDAKDAIRRSRALIPVGPHGGASPIDFAQQVDFAKSMALAKFSLPEHLHRNVGDCLAIIDLASRAGGLSPYMLAGLTYVDPSSKRLALMSQAYHALVAQSPLLTGDLDVSYEGEGPTRVCIVRGRLRSDGKVREHRSPPLADVHPGFTLKKGHADGSTGKKRISYAAGLAKKEELAEGEQLIPAGSPLWSRKPDVQLFYDTSRDWVRIFAPAAALGMFSRGDFDHADVEPGPENAKDVTPFAQRVRNGDKSEGHQDGHADRELANLAQEGATPTASQAPAAQTDPGKGEGAGKTPARASEAPKPSAAKPAQTSKKSPGESAKAKAAADRAEKRAAEAKAAEQTKTAKDVPATAAACKTADAYVAYADRWIDAEPLKGLQATWDEESDVRDKLKVPIKERARLQNKISDRLAR